MAKGLSRPFVLSKGGMYIMKTVERNVVVEISENGRAKRLIYPIVSDNGELMTHRLRRLLAGKLGYSGGDGLRKDVHFVGMVWKKPYTLLQELTGDRVKMQQKLAKLEGHDKLTDFPPTIVPDRASQGRISTLVQNELHLRDELKRRLRRHERITGVKLGDI